jgi:hypothetical protein
MRRFGAKLNTTFLSGSLTTLVGWLATGHRLRAIRHHLLVLVGLVGGAILAALLVLHAPVFAPAVQLVALAAALCAAGWQARASGGVGDHPDDRMTRLLSTVRTPQVRSGNESTETKRTCRSNGKNPGRRSG